MNDTGGSGDLGSLDVRVEGLLEITSEGTIRSESFGEGGSGELRIQAGELRMTGPGDGLLTTISTGARDQNGRAVGNLSVQVAGNVELSDGALIHSVSYAEGVSAGQVLVEAGSMRMDGGDG